MRRCWKAKQAVSKYCQWNAIGFLSEPARHVVSDCNLFGWGIALIGLQDESFTEECEEITSETNVRKIFVHLHHEQDRGAIRPAREDFFIKKVHRVADDFP